MSSVKYARRPFKFFRIERSYLETLAVLFLAVGFLAMTAFLVLRYCPSISLNFLDDFCLKGLYKLVHE